MADAKTFVAGAPAWVDLATRDPAAAKSFYGKLFGWHVQDLGPDSGGYTFATLGGKNVAGIGPTQGEQQPTAWAVYIGTRDADAVAKKVEAAGGKVVAPPFDVFDSGRMAVFQDPGGAFVSVWQPNKMQGAEVMQQPGTFSWAELNARGVDKVKPFYSSVFGWGEKLSPTGEGGPPYTEFKLGDESIAGGMEMNPMVPRDVPAYWLVYFGTSDVDKTFEKALELGGRELVAPVDFPGGRFAVVTDPQGAAFGLLSTRPE